ncbi:MAG: response regulator transcription factor [Candidatus Aminicenantes bacterium]|nr:response regulator transcription factor [Candidatus Aminicenantes bacterium]
MNEKIALVEDEPDLARLTAQALEQEGFRVSTYFDAAGFYRSLDKSLPDLILLDLMLPDADGLDVCRIIRRNETWQSIPVICVTAKGGETDRVLGLELGADDYVVKPIAYKELAARIRAVLRRGRAEAPPARLSIGDGAVEMDPERFEVRLAGKPLELTTTEFKLLYLLASKPGRVFTREQILDKIWGNEKIVLDRTVDVHIKNLREKLGEAARYLKNIRGVGYKVES